MSDETPKTSEEKPKTLEEKHHIPPTLPDGILTEDQKTNYENYIVGESRRILTPARVIINLLGIFILLIAVWLFFSQKRGGVVAE